MANIIRDLKKGLKIGEKTHTKAELREVTVADMIDGAVDAERLISTPDGYQLVASPALAGMEVLRRQIVRIGDYEGPLSMKELKMLSSSDLDVLQDAASELETATLKATEDRGRNSASS